MQITHDRIEGGSDPRFKMVLFLHEFLFLFGQLWSYHGRYVDSKIRKIYIISNIHLLIDMDKVPYECY